MKTKLFVIITFLCVAVQGALAQNEPIVWDFEDEAQLDNWTLVDKNGDGFNWKYFKNLEHEYGRMTTHSGDGIVISESFDNHDYEPLSPDNWLISPEVTLGGTLSFWACGQDNTYFHEVFAVYVCVEGETSGEGSVEVGNYHFLKLSSDITTTKTMTNYGFSLSQYQGQKGRFAIRHYNVSDEFVLNVDDIELDITKEYIPDPTTPTNLRASQAATYANVAWDGAEGDSWKLRYRVVNPAETKNILWDLTIDNYKSQSEGWTTEDRDGDGNNWEFFYSDYDPTSQLGDQENVCFYSYSWSTPSGNLNPDNWLMTPELPLGGIFKFWAKNESENYLDVLGVYVVTDEETVQIGEDIIPPSYWTEYTFDTSKYNGKVGKIAFRHYNSNSQMGINVDYISYYKEGDAPAEWIEVNGLTTTSHRLTDLTAETTYEVQVQAYNNEKESEWSGSTIFTTKDLTDFAENGSGTETDPYIITTVAQMQTLATKMNPAPANQEPEHFAGVYFALGNDLDFSGATFTTIATGGGVKYNFAGTFDGRGHTISGINFDTGTTGRRGIFGVLRNGGTVKNLTLRSSTIKGGDATGGIVGRLMAYCLVENCHVENDVTIHGNNNYVGGVVGYNAGGTIRACSSAATISGDYYIGGITGSCEPGSTVENCLYLGGSIEGTEVGAIVGREVNSLNNPFSYSYGGNLYYTTASIKGVNGSDKSGAERGYKITSGSEDLTIKYNDGSLIRYDNDFVTKIGDGLHYKGVYYGKAVGNVNIVASVPSGTITKLETTAGTLTGSFNYYRLTFAEADAVITATIAPEPIAVTLYDNDTEAASNATVISTNDEKYANVTLSGRTFFKDDKWNTLCLPFDLVIKGSPLEDATIMVFDGENSFFDNNTGTLTINFTDYTEPVFTAGTVCIVKWNVATPSEVESPVFNGVIIKDVEPVATSSRDGAVTFVGRYAAYMTGKEDNTLLYLGADNTLYWPNSNMTIGALRATFQLNNGLVCGEPDSAGQVRAFALHFGDDSETGISHTNAHSTIATNSWYSIDGRKLPGKPALKGVYISNGHKILIK